MAIVALGLLSRQLHTGHVLLDKYAGDALYAAMVYVLVRLSGRTRVALWAAVLMLAIECFQLTGIPAALLRTESPLLRIVARLSGTQFSVLDLVAYALGIAVMKMVDYSQSTWTSTNIGPS